MILAVDVFKTVAPLIIAVFEADRANDAPYAICCVIVQPPKDVEA